MPHQSRTTSIDRLPILPQIPHVTGPTRPHNASSTTGSGPPGPEARPGPPDDETVRLGRRAPRTGGRQRTAWGKQRRPRRATSARTHGGGDVSNNWAALDRYHRHRRGPPPGVRPVLHLPARRERRGAPPDEVDPELPHPRRRLGGEGRAARRRHHAGQLRQEPLPLHAEVRQPRAQVPGVSYTSVDMGARPARSGISRSNQHV